MNTTTKQQVTVSLDGILFTGQLVRKYVNEYHDIILVIKPAYYEMLGKRIAAETDDSVLRVSADALV